MATGSYTPAADAVIHEVTVYLDERPTPGVVHLSQGDNGTLGIIAAELYSNSMLYIVPSGATVRIRMKKSDETEVYYDSLGLDPTRTIAYFEVTEQMSAAAGDGVAIIEVSTSAGVVGSAYTTMSVDRNPIAPFLESLSQYKSLDDLLDQITEMTDKAIAVVNTDKTLSIEGAPADAKVAGAAFLLSSLVTSTALTSSDDMFNLTAGSYTCSGGSNTPANCPTTNSFRCIVFQRNVASRFISIIFDYAMNVYINSGSAAGGWYDEWMQVANTNEVQELDEKIQTVNSNAFLLSDLTTSTALTSSDDMFNLTAGSYTCSGGSNTPANCPTTNSFRCIVFQRNVASRFISIIFDYAMNVYINSGSAAGGWYDEWMQVANTNEVQELDEKIQTVNTAFSVYNPLATYYSKFVRREISTSNTTIGYGSSSTKRYSCIVNLDQPLHVSMTNPDYVFRLYWFEESTEHHVNWGVSWEIPANTDVGLTIKRLDDGAFDDEEVPHLYLIPITPTNSPKSYYLDEIDSVVKRVQEANTEPGLCLLVSTDHHTMSVLGIRLKYDTVSDMVANMNAVCSQIRVDANISLGDIADFKWPSAGNDTNFGLVEPDANTLDDVFYHWMKYGVDMLAAVNAPFIYVIGNHDDNRYINADTLNSDVSEYDYSPGEMYAYYSSRTTPERVFNDENNGLDYYIDWNAYKIRMFCLDSNYYTESRKGWHYGFSDATATWFTEELKKVPEDWSVLLLSHISPIQGNNSDNVARKNMSVIQNEIQSFISDGGNYIATLYGHSHIDWSSTDPWLEITFNCQKCRNSTTTYDNMPGGVNPTRTVGTASEDCWNVVLIQPKSRKIKCIRFGAGEDREFTY